jgi:diaminopimelate epimerase
MIPFVKYTGCGNDFVMIDRFLRSRNHFFSALLSQSNTTFIHTIQQLCDRKMGIGADGVIFLDPPSLEQEEKADFRMRIFNRDGSEAEMCGNGIRCLFAFACDCGWRADEARIETQCGVLRARKINELIQIEMSDPQSIESNFELARIDCFPEIKQMKFYSLNTGVPHLVGFVASEEELEKINLSQIGPHLRHHEKFGKGGTNVNFAYLVGKNRLKIRTYERGVEGETLACGTGATAAAIAAAIATGRLYNGSKQREVEKESVEVIVASGDLLVIDFQIDKEKITHVLMSGPAKRL